MKARIFFVCFFLCAAICVFGQVKIDLSGAVEWDKMEINATVALDLAPSGLKLPAGRTQSEAIIASEYIRLIRPDILHLQVDSSTVIADLIRRGEWNLLDVENLILQARAVPPALSPDFGSLLGFYTLGIGGISAAFIRHDRPAEIPRTLNPVSVPAYTGIVIIASGELPVHGMKSPALLKPCLFPKIWDTGMRLIFERNMLNPTAGAMVRYFASPAIFAAGPSGLSREIASVVGERPLRIFANGVFGIQPTDPVITKEDALLIISTEANRSLLRDGRVAIILEETMLRNELGNEQ